MGKGLILIVWVWFPSVLVFLTLWASQQYHLSGSPHPEHLDTWMLSREEELIGLSGPVGQTSLFEERAET